ncbi:MAG: SxtJ family membrane protein [Pseudomonadota bacterium]
MTVLGTLVGYDLQEIVRPAVTGTLKMIAHRNPKLPASYRSERQFGLLLAAAAIVPVLWPFFAVRSSSWLWGGLSLTLLTLSWGLPQLLTPVARLWLRLGRLLGYINNRILLALIFFAVVTPVALYFRLIGRDVLKLKSVQSSSYWLRRDKEWPAESFKNQF